MVASQLPTGNLTLNLLDPIKDIENPLASYPSREWEIMYRDQYKVDTSFTFVCAPNDTHNCRLRAFVKNGIIVRIEQAYDVSEAEDIYGNKATPTWHPRGCLKGYCYIRRMYSASRIKYPTVRKQWLDWANNGFPRGEDGNPPASFYNRGEDDWVKVSWEEAYSLMAKGITNIATTYNGNSGEALLRKQGYPEEMIDSARDSDGDMAGMRTIKLRGGMAFLGATRIVAMYRFANMLALLDDHIRGKGPEKSVGSSTFDNYAWHTDLPPGHPMVLGSQTYDQEFNDFWNADLIIVTGLNLVNNKMADPIWWQSAMERGKKIVAICPEYSSMSTKADNWLAIRPGTDAALMLGISRILIEEDLYKKDYVKKFSDLPILIRTDNLKVLTKEDLNEDTEFLNTPNTFVGVKGESLQHMPDELKTNPVIVNKNGKLIALNRNTMGKYFEERLTEIGSSLSDINIDWSGEIETKNEGKIKVRTTFNLYRELLEEYTPENTETITSIPKAQIIKLAHDIASANATSFLCGMGQNMYLNNSLINRAHLLVGCLSGNIGIPGGNVSSYAGNYKAAVFNGIPSYAVENPFDQNLDSSADGRDIKKKSYVKYESIHYWAHGDRPLIVDSPKYGRTVMTGKTHMPRPTKMVWACNANLLGNAKHHYDIIANVLPHQDLYVAQDLEWNMNCEYADIVLPCEAWTEFSYPDMTASCTNPFLQMFPKGLPTAQDAKHDIEIFSGVSKAFADMTGDKRFEDHWKFVFEKNVEVYLQRILDASSAYRGYNVKEIIDGDKGVLTLFRTYPRIPGWEQIQDNKPFYTRTGRMEFYRDEDEWINQGENLIVHREPGESTPYLPNAIVSPKNFEGLNPKDYEIPIDSTDADAITIRNNVMTTDELLNTKNALKNKFGLNIVLITPKPRHRTHSSWGTSDWNVIWSSNFGDPYRMDKRTPWVGEEEMDINPEDARASGIQDGDYMWVDANPQDRPYVGWKKDDPLYKVSRLMIRAHFNPSLPKGMGIIIHGMYGATHRSVKAHETNPDKLAITDTGYHPALRYGSQQSTVRTWLNPTQSTDSMVRKDYYTHNIGKGFLVDVNTVTGAPKESMVKISLAEKGGLDGKGDWDPVKSGFTPGNESEDMKKYLKGGFIVD